MIRRIRQVAIALILALAGLWAAALGTSREESLLAHAYELAFGPPDQGHVDFETYRRGLSPNEALACPPGLCRNAAADFDPGVYPFSEEELRRRFSAFALAQPDVVLVYRHERPGLPSQDRYIQRTPLMRLPATINVRFVPLTETTSTLAVHSRSQIGWSDMGANLKRIRLWTDNPLLRGGG